MNSKKIYWWESKAIWERIFIGVLFVFCFYLIDTYVFPRHSISSCGVDIQRALDSGGLTVNH